MKRMILTALAGLPIADVSRGETPTLSPRIARKATACDYEEWFRRGVVDGIPCGKTRGTVLYSQGHWPKLKARLQGSVWKGKHFHADGTLTNRWRGFEAVSAPVSIGESWLDGQACIVMEYADDAKIFGGIRDELRRIAPGVWLGRSLDSATGQFKCYFLLRD